MQYDIETFSLTKVFSDWWGRDKVYAVNDLNLKVRNNEVFGLLGPNGSGKTTTLKMLLGLLYPTKGKTLVLGGDSTDPKISFRIGFMPEESYLYRYLNARETLDFYGNLFGLPRKLRKMRIEALLEMVGLKAVANRAVGTYSKGMARRIGLAQALINDPDLLILDEPTTGLDPIGTRQIKDLVIELAKRGKTILLCSHLLADVEDVCDRISILYGGQIQAEGDVKALLQQSSRKQINTGALSDSALEQIRRIVETEQTDCVVTSPMEKLETFFIKTVAAARQQGQAAGGVVSDTTAQISDFLTAEKPAPDILDKLVSAPVSTLDTVKPVATEKPATIERQPLTDEPDGQLLDRLAKPSTPKTKRVVRKKKEQIKPVTSQPERAEQIKKNILDELTGGSSSEPANINEEETGNQPGDSSNA